MPASAMITARDGLKIIGWYGPLVWHPPVGMANLGRIPTFEPIAAAGVGVEHHRTDVVESVFMGL